MRVLGGVFVVFGLLALAAGAMPAEAGEEPVPAEEKVAMVVFAIALMLAARSFFRVAAQGRRGASAVLFFLGWICNVVALPFAALVLTDYFTDPEREPWHLLGTLLPGLVFGLAWIFLRASRQHAVREVSLNVEPEELRPLLTAVATAVEAFPEDLAGEVDGAAAELAHDAEQTWKRTVRHRKRKVEVKVRVFRDGLDTFDVFFKVPNELADEIDAAINEFHGEG